jgi:hypothetical protein
MTYTEITVPADESLTLQFVTGGTITVNGEDVTVSPGQTITFTDPDNAITVEIPAGITVTVIDISDPAAIVFDVDGVLAFLFVDTTVTLDAGSPITISSFIVPLTDMRVDDRHLDDFLFGGYDDFALTGTGMVYITAWVHDIAFKHNHNSNRDSSSKQRHRPRNSGRLDAHSGSNNNNRRRARINKETRHTDSHDNVRRRSGTGRPWC